MPLETEQLEEYLDLEDHKKQLEFDLRMVKDRMATLEQDVLEDMAINGVDRIAIKGRAISPRRSVVANIRSKEAAIEAIRKAGLNEYLGESYNANQISAYLRECDAEGRALPEEFKGAIEPYEKVQLSVRNA